MCIVYLSEHMKILCKLMSYLYFFLLMHFHGGTMQRCRGKILAEENSAPPSSLLFCSKQSLSGDFFY